MLAKRKQHQPVKDADAKSHERVREVNGLLPLVGDRQIRDRQVCLLEQNKLFQMSRMSGSGVSKCQNPVIFSCTDLYAGIERSTLGSIASQIQVHRSKF